MTERMTEYNMGVTDERIVRCRDCKYAASYPDGHEYREPFFCVFHDMDVRSEDFCSWSKAKGEQ